MTHHVKIIAVLTALPGKTDQLRQLLEGMTGPSRDEPGNLRYDLWWDQSEAMRFVLDELYANDDAVATHRASPHFPRYLAQIEELAERTAFTLSPVAVA